MIRRLAFLALTVSFLFSQGVVASPVFAPATAPYTFVFPRDYYAHDSYRTEWWYFTGHLRAKDGHLFGYELTFFRAALRPVPYRVKPGESAWRSAQLYPAHFAISDITSRTFVHHEILARDALGQGYASRQRLEVKAFSWSLTGNGTREPTMHLHANDHGDAIDLTVKAMKPVAIHGRDGISKKGACRTCASHYFSFTRLATSGVLTRGGKRYVVSGVSWMDHEFGSDELSPSQAGWDWFSIQLNDGRDIMLYRLRKKNGATTPQSSGSLVSATGAVRYLPLHDFRIEQTRTWVSPHTHGRYPGAWMVQVAGIKPTLEIVPEIADQELADALGTSYWEGSVLVRDARTHVVLGVGYVELTGYAGVLRL
ncbi:MAG: lipocalin-like domain-containing protein [Vulcanimicrobiaceae bacterium]